jgi:hypothetical protein
MVSGFARFGILNAFVVLGLSQVAATDATGYRDFQLGSSVESVRGLTTAVERDLHTLHARPAMLQVLEWRLPRPASGSTSADPVRQVSFNFVDDQLFRIAVFYDERRTAGLTRADLVSALETTYGEPVASIRQLDADDDSRDSASVVAQWRSDDTVVSLQHIGYLDGYRLLVTSLRLELIARQAKTAALVLETHEAPARAAALLKQRADEERAAADEARSANKAAFRP